MALTGRGTAPAWAVVDDANVPADQVLAQTSTDQTDYRFLLAIYDGVIATKQSRRGPGADTDADRGRQSLTPARTVWTLTGNADKSRSTYTVFARCYLNESA